MGVTAAFVFAAQMVNFPVPGGVSGHLLGAALCALILGPMLGIAAMSMVLIVQCFILQDGGITALGINIVNMAFIGTLSAWLSFRILMKIYTGAKAFHAAVIISSWISVIMCALSVSLELALSGAVPLSVVVPAMCGVHLVIGLGEGLLTGLIVVFLYEADRDLISVLRGKRPVV